MQPCVSYPIIPVWYSALCYGWWTRMIQLSLGFFKEPAASLGPVIHCWGPAAARKDSPFDTIVAEHGAY